jgi:5-(carboxyamino)imidazole ribonucleotide synthase
MRRWQRLASFSLHLVDMKPIYGGILGIVGGGQLGRMMIEAAHRLGIRCKVLDPDPNCCAKSVADDFVCGSLDDSQQIMAFGKDCTWVTVEFEHVSTDGLRRLIENGITVHPHPDHLDVIKDKGTQKEFYAEQGLDTAPFVLINNENDFKQALHLFPAVQKTRLMGYDGKGVKHIKDLNDISTAFKTPSVLEKKASILQEFSIIGARNIHGDVVLYPASDLYAHPHDHLLDYLVSPSSLSKAQIERAETLTKTLLSTMNYVGLMAVEFFANTDGSVWINECAPRPHNSGHHTIEANETSQFQQHIRAVLGLPLGSTECHCKTAMVNILGPNNVHKQADSLYYALLHIKGIHLHLYGKQVLKPKRKIGHVTVTASSDQELKNSLNQVKSILEQWRNTP